MRVIALMIATAVAAVSVPASTAQVAGSSTSVASDPKAALVERVQKITDEGDLFDPTSIAERLGLPLRATATDGPINADCSVSFGFTTVRYTTVAVVGESWFRATRSGRGRVPVPAFAINPATMSGDPVFAYRIDRYVHGRDIGGGLVDSTEATLSFDGLPSFACISTEDLNRLLPGSEYFIATDGVSLVRYAGKVDAEAGTRTEFIFRAGVPCALAATIRQHQTWGLRYLNADYEYQVCRTAADADYCSAHPEVVWPDGISLRDLIRTSDGLCGTPDSIYRQIKAADTAPPKAPRQRNGSNPCERR